MTAQDYIGIAAIVTALFTGISSIIASMATFYRIKELAVNTNSIKDALVKTTGAEAYARGKKDQKDGS